MSVLFWVNYAISNSIFDDEIIVKMEFYFWEELGMSVIRAAELLIDHGDNPDDDIDCRIHMQSGPNFRKDLTTVIKAPNGDYVCFAGMWFDEKNKYAYLEPLATVPKYRRKGLATIALMTGMKKTNALGATYCFGGVHDFYTAIGFETICHREMWRREW